MCVAKLKNLIDKVIAKERAKTGRKIAWNCMSLDSLVYSTDPKHPANLICTLCRQFFHNSWCTGTGGGISIKHAESGNYFIAPSGVQKEQMDPEHLFVMDSKTHEYLRVPENLKPSACTPLFVACYQHRNAGAIIHTHSQNAVICSLLFDDEFRIANIEQIKAIPSDKVDSHTGKPIPLSFYDTLTIPIIENMAHEDQLVDSLLETFEKYPHTCAVIVRRHGIFVWGPTIDKAKVFNEAIDYLMELAVKMHQLGIPSDCAIGEEKKFITKGFE